MLAAGVKNETMDQQDKSRPYMCGACLQRMTGAQAKGSEMRIHMVHRLFEQLFMQITFQPGEDRTEMKKLVHEIKEKIHRLGSVVVDPPPDE